ncbi:hypothetical protein PF003_g13346 [Phytophthora fragariae]|nr:hypothetical protein PF003_g13346 [Phytophthora fragariae]
MGVAVSAYGIHVKTRKMALKDEYTALCDLEAFSCSEVLTSEYSSLLLHLGLVEKHSMLDVSYAYLGVLMYALFALYPVVVMVYLAFILAFVLRDFCLVCVATYGITAALLWSSLALLRAERHQLQSSKADKSE